MGRHMLLFQHLQSLFGFSHLIQLQTSDSDHSQFVDVAMWTVDVTMIGMGINYKQYWSHVVYHVKTSTAFYFCK